MDVIVCNVKYEIFNLRNKLVLHFWVDSVVLKKRFWLSKERALLVSGLHFWVGASCPHLLCGLSLPRSDMKEMGHQFLRKNFLLSCPIVFCLNMLKQGTFRSDLIWEELPSNSNLDHVNLQKENSKLDLKPLGRLQSTYLAGYTISP